MWALTRLALLSNTTHLSLTLTHSPLTLCSSSTHPQLSNDGFCACTRPGSCMGLPCQALDLVLVPEICFLASAVQVPNFESSQKRSLSLFLQILFLALSEDFLKVQNESSLSLRTVRLSELFSHLFITSLTVWSVHPAFLFLDDFIAHMSLSLTFLPLFGWAAHRGHLQLMS